MKTLFLIAISLCVVFFSCKKEDSKSCYEFVTTVTTTVSPHLTGYPQTTTSTSESCGLTPAEAATVASNLTSTSHTTQSNYTITVTQTCSYHLK